MALISERARELVGNEKLPSPKGVALAIVEVCRREDASLSDVAALVQTDPALSVRLLHLANLAKLGTRPVASSGEAVIRLGMNTVRQLAMSFSLVDQFLNGECAGFDYQHFWSHSLLMAVASQELCARTQLGPPDELFACGLLARIGSLGLATIYPEEYASVLAEKDEDLLARERATLHIDHNELTLAFLAESGVPMVFAEAVAHHESPGKSGFSEGSRIDSLTQLLHAAKRLADLGISSESERSGIAEELTLICARLGLDQDRLGELADGIFSQWREWGELLRVPSERVPRFAEMAAARAPFTRVDAREESDTPDLRILLVGPDVENQRVAKAQIAALTAREPVVARNGEEALGLAFDVNPHIIITDWEMPNSDGLDLCKALRATEWGQSVYIIILVGNELEDQLDSAFEAGVDDYLMKPFDAKAITARMRAAIRFLGLLRAWEKDRAKLKHFAAELATSNRRLERAALTDQLTELPNRRAGLDALIQEWSAANRANDTVSLMIIDVDRFKSINDSYGHAVGDTVLREVASAIRKTARREDSVCRLGGEEFLVICHKADIRAALHSAARMLSGVRSLSIATDGLVIKVTISIGLAQKEDSIADTDALMTAADKALYQAKDLGRNQICFTLAGKVHSASRPR